LGSCDRAQVVAMPLASWLAGAVVEAALSGRSPRDIAQLDLGSRGTERAHRSGHHA
jgi:hypothetical protein